MMYAAFGMQPAIVFDLIAEFTNKQKSFYCIVHNEKHTFFFSLKASLRI